MRHTKYPYNHNCSPEDYTIKQSHMNSYLPQIYLSLSFPPRIFINDSWNQNKKIEGGQHFDFAPIHGQLRGTQFGSLSKSSFSLSRRVNVIIGMSCDTYIHTNVDLRNIRLYSYSGHVPTLSSMCMHTDVCMYVPIWSYIYIFVHFMYKKLIWLCCHPLANQPKAFVRLLSDKGRVHVQYFHGGDVFHQPVAKAAAPPPSRTPTHPLHYVFRKRFVVFFFILSLLTNQV